MPWWSQKAAEEQRRVTVEAILEEKRVQRRQEYDRSDGRKGGLYGGRTDREEYGHGGRHRYDGTETGDAQVGR